MLAIISGLAFEIGACAAPILRFRPGGAAGVVRHPSFARQGMGVEIVVEGTAQRHRYQSIRRFDLTAALAKGAVRRLQDKLHRRARDVALCESRGGRENGSDQSQHTQRQSIDRWFRWER